MIIEKGVKMNIQIIETYFNGVNINSVNARQMHEYLKVKTKFADWIKRAIEKYDFIENQDFTILKNGNGANAFIDYIVTLDMGKELAMLENNEKGKETRKYFIDIEKQKARPLTYEETMQQALLLADQRVKALEHKIIVEKPLTDFGRAISQSNTTITVGDFAKSIEKELNIDFGRNKCFKWLRENDYLMNNNQPYQKWINQGLFQVSQHFRTNANYSKIDIVTLVTGKGQEYLFNKMQKVIE
jgi:anti-repressor protein